MYISWCIFISIADSRGVTGVERSVRDDMQQKTPTIVVVIMKMNRDFTYPLGKFATSA